MNNPIFVPEGIQPMRIGEVALVLGFPESTVRRWTRTGRLPCKQVEIGMHRYVLAEDLAWFAHQLGLTPYWERALPID